MMAKYIVPIIHSYIDKMGEVCMATRADANA